MTEVEIWTDGSTRPTNPGPGGWAAVLCANGWRREIAGFDPHSTNNRMELMAAISALEALRRPCSVTLYSDSKYVINGITKWIHGWHKSNWKNGKVKNRDLWERLAAAHAQHKMYWLWVRGHIGHELNERADVLAGEAAYYQRAISEKRREPS